MNRALRFAMVALVLVNLGFVSITEAARAEWLAPLVVLTLASPWLARFAHRFEYRAAWNLGVMGVFGLLVHHFTSRGAAFLLEDGLLLAALCQVHLLNNAGTRQKPDLLFFNSFLIAVVTSFLSFDVAYSAVFALYVPVLVVALQLLALERARTRAGSGPGEDAPPLPPRLVARVTAQGLVRGAAVLAVTLGAFALVPRDFGRQGLLGGRWKLRPPGSLEVGFNPSIDFSRRGRVTSSDRVVMRVQLERGNPADVPAYWRGATLTFFDGRQWRSGGRHDRRAVERWRRRGARELVRLGGRADAEVSVELEGRRGNELFLPLRASRLVAKSVYAVRTYPDFTLRSNLPGQFTRYRVGLANPVRTLGGAIRSTRGGDLVCGAEHLPAKARAVAKRLHDELGPDARQQQFVVAVREYLVANYRYLPPGADGGARNLHDLFGSRPAGHCEVFASAYALMLRSRGVPARVVTGYRSTEWNGEQTELTVRARHAHAWVEVLDPRGRWYTVDATPAAGEDALAAGAGWTDRARLWAAGLWAKVVGFNASAQAGVAAWCKALPRRVLGALRARPWASAAACLALIALLVVARRVRRRRIPAAVSRYRGLLRRYGIVAAPGETPRSLLARLELAPSQRTELEAATREHERQRYAVGPA